MKKAPLAAALDTEVTEEVERLLGAQAVEEIDLEAMEMGLRRRTLQVAARIVEHRLNADHSDYQGGQLRCRCGQNARYVDRRGKTFISVLGELNLERAYYYGAACDEGFCPRDRVLRLDGFALSPAVLRMTGTVASLVSFQEGSERKRNVA